MTAIGLKSGETFNFVLRFNAHTIKNSVNVNLYRFKDCGSFKDLGS